MTNEKQNRGKLLIVEDKLEESLNAMSAAEKVGFTDIVTASTLEEALYHLPNIQAVATDLFFPAGSINTEAYVQRILPLYMRDQASSKGIVEGTSQIYEAIKNVSTSLGMTPEQYIEEVLAIDKSNHGFILETAIASLPGYQRRFDIKDFLGDEENLPLGVLVTEEAQRYGIPSVIVTSASDHSTLLRPLLDRQGGIIQVPYVDKLVNGEKDWAGGLVQLIEQKSNH